MPYHLFLSSLLEPCMYFLEPAGLAPHLYTAVRNAPETPLPGISLGSRRHCAWCKHS